MTSPDPDLRLQTANGKLSCVMSGVCCSQGSVDGYQRTIMETSSSIDTTLLWDTGHMVSSIVVNTIQIHYLALFQMTLKFKLRADSGLMILEKHHGWCGGP